MTAPAYPLAEYGTFQVAVTFAAWAMQRRQVPTASDVVERFGVSNATANRWLNALESVTGQTRDRRSKGGRRPMSEAA